MYVYIIYIHCFFQLVFLFLGGGGRDWVLGGGGGSRDLTLSLTIYSCKMKARHSHSTAISSNYRRLQTLLYILDSEVLQRNNIYCESHTPCTRSAPSFNSCTFARITSLLMQYNQLISCRHGGLLGGGRGGEAL